MTKISAPGVYDLPAAIYHADPCPEPSLSSSVAKAIVLHSPLHAKFKHPRLTEQEPKEPSAQRDIGSAVHEMALGAGPGFVIIEKDSYRTDVAKAARKAAYAEGKTPLLTADYETARGMATILRPVVQSFLKGPSLAEAVIAWRENGAWCRTMVDAMDAGKRIILDIKTTEASCDPYSINRRFNEDANDIQAAFIERGLDALDPDGRGRRKFIFIYQEQSPPHAVTPLLVSEASLTVARHSVEFAIATWADCLARNEWPGYGAARSEPTLWMQQRRAARMSANNYREAAE